MPRPSSTTVIDSSEWIVTRDFLAVAGERFVDRVVDDLENHVVETGAVIGVADVHSGTFSDGFEAL